MDKRNRVLKCLRRQKPDKIPYEFSLTPKLMKEFQEKTGSKSPAEYYDFDIRSVAQRPTKLQTDFSEYLPKLTEGSIIDEWGIGHVPGSTLHFRKMVHPMEEFKSVSELESYPFADTHAEYRLQDLKEEVSELHSQGYFVDGFAGHIFECAWGMRGLDNLLVDFHHNEDFANYLLDRVTDRNAVVASEMAKADIDMLRVGDDVGTQKALMMSPNIWRKYLKPRLAREIAEARNIKPDIHVWYHSDGDISDIIEDLIEVGVDVLNPVQPECLDPVWVKQTYGDRISLWGTIGTQTVMPFGTPEEVKKTVKRNIELLGYNGGLVLAPTHVLEPDVPWENVVAFVEACRNKND